MAFKYHGSELVQDMKELRTRINRIKRGYHFNMNKEAAKLYLKLLDMQEQRHTELRAVNGAAPRLRYMEELRMMRRVCRYIIEQPTPPVAPTVTINRPVQLGDICGDQRVVARALQISREKASDMIKRGIVSDDA